MALERAAVLYLRNSTTVDTGAGIDVRLLDDVNGSTNDETQTVQATHTQDNEERTFDPASNNVAVQDATTLQKLGWALRLTEDMTPVDDAACNAFLPAGTLTVNLMGTLVATGGTNVGGNNFSTWRAALYRYNPATDTGTFIASGSVAAQWNTVVAYGVGDAGNYKLLAIPVIIPAGGIEFAAGEILLVQVGLNTGSQIDATLGTTTYTYTLRVDTADTNITWAANQGIRQTCPISSSLTGRGTPTRSASLVAMARNAVGKGVPAMSRVASASKSFILVGKGTPTASRLAAAVRSFDLIGKGSPSMSRVAVAAKSFSLAGKGTASESPKQVAMARSATGKGVIILSKSALASKTFNLIGKGVVTEVHPVQAFRTFDLEGRGQVDGTITLPLDEVPGGGAPTTVRKPIYVFDD